MDSAFYPAFLFVGCALGLACLMYGMGRVMGPRRAGRVKEMPYESGMDPINDARRRFDVRFHLVAIAFLLFDVELLFLYPWAVASRNPEGIDRAVAATQTAAGAMRGATDFSRLLVFGEVMVFIALLALGLVYAWRKGVFQWR